MIPRDKFGNEIYSSVFDQMCEYALTLKELGFKEAKRKPNLFYKPYGDSCVFADFRGFEKEGAGFRRGTERFRRGIMKEKESLGFISVKDVGVI